ncbi:MAG: gluconokinase [Pseudonocardiales bacterium]|nr:gluconokinase [Pseudonocardiales bacterium]
MVGPVASGRLPVLVIMGVSGSGKSTVAGVLAERLGWDLAEGDDLHPPENVAKMASGQPLDDEDRRPWLAKVAAWIRAHTEAGRPGIVTASALKRRYRDVLRGEHVVFVYLAGAPDQIAHRIAARHGHYMPPALLGSQLDALEPPGEDENALTGNISGSPGEEADDIIARLQLIRSDPADPGT